MNVFVGRWGNSGADRQRVETLARLLGHTVDHAPPATRDAPLRDLAMAARQAEQPSPPQLASWPWLLDRRPSDLTNASHARQEPPEIADSAWRDTVAREIAQSDCLVLIAARPEHHRILVDRHDQGASCFSLLNLVHVVRPERCIERDNSSLWADISIPGSAVPDSTSRAIELTFLDSLTWQDLTAGHAAQDRKPAMAFCMRRFQWREDRGFACWPPAKWRVTLPSDKFILSPSGGLESKLSRTLSFVTDLTGKAKQLVYPVRFPFFPQLVTFKRICRLLKLNLAQNSVPSSREDGVSSFRQGNMIMLRNQGCADSQNRVTDSAGEHENGAPAAAESGPANSSTPVACDSDNRHGLDEVTGAGRADTGADREPNGDHHGDIGDILIGAAPSDPHALLAELIRGPVAPGARPVANLRTNLSRLLAQEREAAASEGRKSDVRQLDASNRGDQPLH